MGQTLRGWFSRFESIDPVSLLLRHLATPWAGAKGIFFYLDEMMLPQGPLPKPSYFVDFTSPQFQ